MGFDEALYETNRAVWVENGVVYTPPEVVGFCVRSINDVLESECGAGVCVPAVEYIEPFAGTGNFVKGLLDCGCKGDIRAFEIMPEAVAIMRGGIAAENVSIEQCDTFNREWGKQRGGVSVIITNPPDGNGAGTYEAVDGRIRKTYAAGSRAVNKNALYDGYFRFFRLFSDYLTNGIICAVVNNGFLESLAADGFRRCVSAEFDKAYIFNLRGNARMSGEQRRKEGGKIFDGHGGGCRCGIAIVLLVKKR
jgi:predicted helicase